MMLNHLRLIAVFLLLFATSSHSAAIPGSVSNFTVSKSQVSEGETVTLSWGKPSGYLGTVKYNVYITKPSENRWKYKSLISSTSFNRWMGGLGTHKFEVEACNADGQCGSPSSLNVTVSEPPPPLPGKVSNLSASKSQMTEGETITLSWGKPSGYSGTVKYNVYITKPSENRWKYKSLISSTSFNRWMGGLGTHKFEVEACNADGQCGSPSSLNVTVSEPPPPLPGKVSNLSASKSQMTEGETITLSWGKPSGYSGTVKYNVYITKPSENRWKYKSLISSTSFNRYMSGIGTHKFEVEACNIDGQCGSTSSLYVTVKAANTAPTISNITNKTIDTSSSTGSISFTVNDNETAAGSLSVSRASSNTALIPTGNIVLGGSGNNRTVSITPIPNLTGSATITLTVTDGGNLTDTDTFVVTVVEPIPGAVESLEAKCLIDGVQVVCSEVAEGENVYLSWNKPNGFTRNLTYRVFDTKPGKNRYEFHAPISYTSITRQMIDVGIHTLDVEACNINNACGPRSEVNINVIANMPPTIADIADISVVAGVSSDPITFTVSDTERAADTLTVTASSSDTSLIPTENIVLDGNSSNRTVTITPLSNTEGTVTVTITVTDAKGLVASDDFVVTVIALKPNIGSLNILCGDGSSCNQTYEGETITIDWEKPTGFEGDLIYKLYAQKPGESEFQFHDPVNYTVIGRYLEIPGIHTFSVEACTTLTSCGERSYITVEVLALSTPPQVTVTVMGADIIIDWEHFPDASSYWLQESVDGANWENVNSDLTTKIHSLAKESNVDIGTYYYRVKFCNTSCSSFSDASTPVVIEYYNVDINTAYLRILDDVEFSENEDDDFQNNLNNASTYVTNFNLSSKEFNGLDYLTADGWTQHFKQLETIVAAELLGYSLSSDPSYNYHQIALAGISRFLSYIEDIETFREENSEKGQVCYKKHAFKCASWGNWWDYKINIPRKLVSVLMGVERSYANREQVISELSKLKFYFDKFLKVRQWNADGANKSDIAFINLKWAIIASRFSENDKPYYVRKIKEGVFGLAAGFSPLKMDEHKPCNVFDDGNLKSDEEVESKINKQDGCFIYDEHEFYNNSERPIEDIRTHKHLACSGFQFDNSFAQKCSEEEPVYDTEPKLIDYKIRRQVYSGNYGVIPFKKGIKGISYVRGTVFQNPLGSEKLYNEMLENINKYFLEHVSWIIHKGRLDLNTIGKKINVNNFPVKHNFDEHLGQLIAYYQEELIDFPPALIDLVGKLMVSSVQNPENFIGNQMFWSTDYMTHAGNNYLSTVRGISKRTVGTERVDPDEPEFKHSLMGAGTHFIMINGNEYTNIHSVWDWNRLPGITTEQLLTADQLALKARGLGDFVGGVTDNKLGAFFMDISGKVTYRGDDDKVTDDDGNGNVGKTQITRSIISTQKSWFHFDNAIIAVGNKIDTSQTENLVVTSVEQSLKQGNVEYKYYGETGQFYTLSSGNATGNIEWVTHNGMRYYFPKYGDKEQDIHLQLESVGEKEIFSLWINHENGSDNEEYKYLIEPIATENGLAKLTNIAESINTSATSHSVNDDNNTFVFEKVGNGGWISGHNFNGNPLKVKLNTKGAVLLSTLTTGELKLTVSDPSQTPYSYIKLELEGNFKKLSSCIGAEPAEVGDVCVDAENFITVKLPVDDYAGQSTSITLLKE